MRMQQSAGLVSGNCCRDCVSTPGRIRTITRTRGIEAWPLISVWQRYNVALPSIKRGCNSVVEYLVANEVVVGSSPITRSSLPVSLAEKSR
jgi:hypothetical protein